MIAGILIGVMVSAGGCAMRKGVRLCESDPPALLSDVEIPVPFVRQERWYCGPAALESVFAFWQTAVSQQQIAEQIFSPELRGTLMIDLQRYARERGFWTRLARSDFSEMSAYLADGIPVIALERLHPYVLGRQHITVITGIRDNGRTIVQHTGRSAHRSRPRDGFLRNWQAAGTWMLVVAPPELMADTDEVSVLLEAAVAFERRGKHAAAQAVYERIIALDPASPQAYFNAGNIYLRAGELAAAERAYQGAIAHKEDFADAFNNLAYVYLLLRKYEEAHDAVDRALALDTGRTFYYLDTQAQIYWAQGETDTAKEIVARARTLGDTVPPELYGEFVAFWAEKTEAGTH